MMNMDVNPPYSYPYYNRPALQRYDIIKVNGINGANAFQMAPNSKTLLLDETAPILWFVQTDGAGYKTVTPYDIMPHQQAPEITINELAQRVASLEERINAKSNSGTNKNAKRTNNSNANAAADAE